MRYEPLWERIEEEWNENKELEKERYEKEVENDLKEFFLEKGLPSYFYTIFAQAAYDGSDEVDLLMKEFGFNNMHIAALKNDPKEFYELYQQEFYKMRDDFGCE